MTTTTPKPTLLALHGSGSNSTIHTVQLARLSRLLPNYTIESLQAPFPSPAGPGILPFFEGLGPFYRWLPPSEKVSLDAMRAGTSTDVLPEEVEALVRDAVRDVAGRGGEVVGLVGFSQGTKVVAGLLRAKDIRGALGSQDEGTAWLDGLRVAVQVCSSYRPPLVPRSVLGLLEGNEREAELRAVKISTPTFHVLGLKDEWVWAGEGLVGEFDESTSRVEKLDIGHHYPVKPEDSQAIATWLGEVLGEA